VQHARGSLRSSIGSGPLNEEGRCGECYLATGSAVSRMIGSLFGFFPSSR
jgi:hypothetical protein